MTKITNLSLVALDSTTFIPDIQPRLQIRTRLTVLYVLKKLAILDLVERT